jgi:hypothetical protein
MSDPTDDERPRQHPLVEALVPDPTTGVRPTTVLVGFLGNSAQPDHRRLYLTSALDQWVEIATEDILYTRDLPDDAGTQVWVPKDAKLDYHRQAPLSVEAQFLTGSIARQALPRTFGRSVQAAPQMMPSFGWGGNCPLPTDVGPRCGSNTRSDCLPCGSDTRSDCLPCGSDTRSDCLPCGSHTRSDCLPCPSDDSFRFCPSEISPHCPTNVIPCPTGWPCR